MEVRIKIKSEGKIWNQVEHFKAKEIVRYGEASGFAQLMIETKVRVD